MGNGKKDNVAAQGLNNLVPAVSVLVCSQAICRLYPAIAFKRPDLASVVTPAKSANSTRQVDDQKIATSNASLIGAEVKEGDDKSSTPVTFKDGLDVHSEDILNFIDEIIPNGSSLTYNEIIISGKSMKADVSQLEVRRIFKRLTLCTEVKEGDNKYSTPLTSKDGLDVRSGEILDFLIPNGPSISQPHRRRPE